jgi:uncharacterized protein YjbI with pentapeptide repeats
MTERNLAEIETWVREGRDLANGDFKDADLSSRDLSGAKFAGGDFTNANLEHSKLNDADFTGAKLIGTTLYSTNLYGTIFKDADLTDADLADAALGTAIFTDCRGIVDAGTDPRGYRFIGVKRSPEQGGGWMIQAGCRWFDRNEAEEHWGPEDRDNDDALERVAKIVNTD